MVEIRSGKSNVNVDVPGDEVRQLDCTQAATGLQLEDTWTIIPFDSISTVEKSKVAKFFVCETKYQFDITNIKFETNINLIL